MDRRRHEDDEREGAAGRRQTFASRSSMVSPRGGRLGARRRVLENLSQNVDFDRIFRGFHDGAAPVSREAAGQGTTIGASGGHGSGGAWGYARSPATRGVRAPDRAVVRDEDSGPGRALEPERGGGRPVRRREAAATVLSAFAFVVVYVAVFGGLWALGPYVPANQVAGLLYFALLVGAPFGAAMRVAWWVRVRGGLAS